jgi:fructose-bisphosphate aldolase class II
VSYGVIKMNVDTDTQWAFLQPIKSYMDARNDYLRTQLGNPEGPDKPNKKYIDPRNWLYLGEQGLTARVVQACQDLGAAEKFAFLPAPKS